MLIYTEAPLAEIIRGDQVMIEGRGVTIMADVVGTDTDHGALGFVPLIYANTSEPGIAPGIWSCLMPTAESKVFTVWPGEDGVKVLKGIDSEAAVTGALTWERIAEFEPKVLDLLADIKTERPSEYDYLRIWGDYKQRLSEIVGWDRECACHPELHSSAAYNIVYDTLLHNLDDAGL